MLILKESNKTVHEIEKDFSEITGLHKFGVLDTYNLWQKLNDKGVSFDRDCLIFEVCNPQQAGKVLRSNISIATALPCRIALYQEDGKTKIARIKTTALLGLFPNPGLKPVAEEVKWVISQIIAELA